MAIEGSLRVVNNGEEDAFTCSVQKVFISRGKQRFVLFHTLMLNYNQIKVTLAINGVIYSPLCRWPFFGP